jgi:large subunit ribosomal protein L4
MAESATPKLNKEVFSVEVKNHELLKLAYDSYLAASRGANATTLQRGEVRGGGRKPWRQKGTGRARFGSSRNPIWRGGGVVFGPRGNENYTKNISKTSKKVALRQALTLANKAKKIIVSEWKDTGKTRDAYAELKKLNIENKQRILGVCAKKTPEAIRATKNLPNFKLVSAMYLNVYDILNADAIVFSPEALNIATEWLGGEEK